MNEEEEVLGTRRELHVVMGLCFLVGAAMATIVAQVVCR